MRVTSATRAKRATLPVLAVLAVLGSVAALTQVMPASAAPSEALTLVRDIPLTEKAERFDYQWVDETRSRLYIAHLGADALLVLDLADGKVRGRVKGLPSVHGVVGAPERHRIFATVTGEKTLAIIDDRSYAVLARVPAGEYPNGLTYVPRAGKVYVSNNTGVGIGVVDVIKQRALPGIEIGGGAGNTQFDAGSGHVFAAIHKVGALAEIDPATDRVIAKHVLAGTGHCHGLLVDAERRLAFAACDRKTLIAYALDEKKVTGTSPLPEGTDVLALDRALGRVYAASSSGYAGAYDITAARELARLMPTLVGPNAHSVAVDPKTHYVYFPLEDVGGRPLIRVMKPKVTAASPPDRRSN